MYPPHPPLDQPLQLTIDELRFYLISWQLFRIGLAMWSLSRHNRSVQFSGFTKDATALDALQWLSKHRLCESAPYLFLSLVPALLYCCYFNRKLRKKFFEA